MQSYPMAIRPQIIAGQPAIPVQHPVATGQCAAGPAQYAPCGSVAGAVAAQPQAVTTAQTVITAPAQYVTPVSTPVAPVRPVTRVVASAAPAPGVYTQGSVAAPTVVRAAPAVRVVSGAPTVVRPHTLAGPTYTQGHYEAKRGDDPQLQNLKELRKTCGLKHVPVSEGLALLKAAAVDSKLTRDQFLEAYRQVLQKHSIEAPAQEIQNAVFDLFDRDENHVVDLMELICGISLMCSGSEEDKIHAVFDVFDENSDGFISMDEMFKFLTSVFKVVLTPNVMGVMNSMGVSVESPEDLASVTSLECFKTADLNQDGKLSVSEFKSWFYAPRNDPSFLFSPVRKLLQ